jgi:decaprenyl-phosphate phosphoribosyltransferase
MLIDLIRLARPQDWVKNVFVLLPLPFAVAAKEAQFSPAVFLLGLAGFCLVNSAAYTFNDLCDASTDRLHPQKCRRPIAAGRVSRRTAVVELILLLAAGLFLCLATEKPAAVAIVLAYVAINVA